MPLSNDVKGVLQRLRTGTSTDQDSRTLTHQRLVGALQSPGCAFCHLARQHSWRYIETLLNEAVMDVDQRDVWRAARGLCHWHASLALDMPQSASSLAILYDDLLHHDVTALTALVAPNTGWRRRRTFWSRVQDWLQAWRQVRRCLVCQVWLEQERLCITVLLDDWPLPDLAQAFAASDGLCWPHLQRLVAQSARHAHLPAVLAAEQAHLSGLQKDLREFIRKLDYRFAHEPYGPEADAWRRAVRRYTVVEDGS